MKSFFGFASLTAIVVTVLLLHGAGNSPSSPFAVALAKAAAQCQFITDTNTHALPAGAAPTSSLNPETCAIDFGIPAGATGAPGAVGPPGANGVSGYALRTVTRTTTLASGVLTATASCPAGLKAISGGARAVSQKGISGKLLADAVPQSNADSRVNSELEQLTQSEPTANGQGWVAAATYTNAKPNVKTSATLRVTVICAKVS